MSELSDCSYESDESEDYNHKIRHTNHLISQLESKLQTYIKPTYIETSQNNTEPFTNSLMNQMRQQVSSLNKTVETNLLAKSKQQQDSIFPNYEQKDDLMEMSSSRMPIADQSQIKSKMELEREIFEFEKRMRQFQLPQYSQNSSMMNQELDKQRSRLSSQKKLDSLTQSPLEYSNRLRIEVHQDSLNQSPLEYSNRLRIENQSDIQNQQQWTLQHQQYEQDQRSVLKQQEEFLLSINDKLLYLQEQDNQKCIQMENQIEQLQQQQVELLDERNQAVEEQNQLHKVINDVQTFHKQSMKQMLKEDAQILFHDQAKKIQQIRQQSEDLIHEQELKKQKFEVELDQMEREKETLKTEINNQNYEGSELTSMKQDLSEQLNGLINLHNQFLQTDIRRTITNVQQTPIKLIKPFKDKRIDQVDKGSQIIKKENIPTKSNNNSQTKLTPQLAGQIDYLYNLNIQLKNSMDQQLSMIREELNEQMIINKELVVFLTTNPDHQPSKGLKKIIHEEAQVSQPPTIQTTLVDEDYTNLKQKLDVKFSRKAINRESFEDLLMKSKLKHKVAPDNPKRLNNFQTTSKSQQHQKKRNNNVKTVLYSQTTNSKNKNDASFKDVYDNDFQDKILRLNEMVANTLNQIKT